MRTKLFVLFAASALLLLACDVSSLISQFVPQLQQPEEEPTAVAAVPTPVPPGPPIKPPAAPPTKPPVGPSPAPSNPFAEALGKAKTATKYRMQFSIVFGGTEKGKYVEQAFVDLEGMVDGKNSYFKSKGGILAMMTGDEKGTLEIIEADGKTYMKGVKMFGMTDPKVWYVTDAKSGASSLGQFAKPDYYDDFTRGSTAADLRKVRSESLDGQSCDVYLYDLKSLQNAALVGLLDSAKDKEDFGSIDKAEMSFWLCGDGFVHKFLLDYVGHNSENVAEKGALKMTGHFWDFNSPLISVQAPKDAKPMPGR